MLTQKFLISKILNTYVLYAFVLSHCDNEMCLAVTAIVLLLYIGSTCCHRLVPDFLPKFTLTLLSPRKEGGTWEQVRTSLMFPFSYFI